MGRDFVRRSALPRSAEVHGVSGDWPLHDQAWIDDTFRRVAGMLPDKLKKPSPSSPGLQSAPGSVLAIIRGEPLLRAETHPRTTYFSTVARAITTPVAVPIESK